MSTDYWMGVHKPERTSKYFNVHHWIHLFIHNT